jgi:hypothetical protein
MNSLHQAETAAELAVFLSALLDCALEAEL